MGLPDRSAGDTGHVADHDEIHDLLNGKPWINVQGDTYGAAGDGTTDDTTAIQAAIDALTSGGVVFFPPGSYIYSTLNLSSVTNGVHLVGSGINNCTLRTNTTTGTAIDLTSSRFVQVHNMSFSPTAARTSGQLFDVSGADDLLFTNLRISSHFKGFVGDDTDHLRLSYVNFTDFSTSAFQRAVEVSDTGASPSLVEMDNVKFSSSQKTSEVAYFFEGCDTVQLHNVRAQKSSTAEFGGIRMIGCSYAHVSDCMFETGNNDGIKIEGSGSYFIHDCHTVICLNGIHLGQDSGGTAPSNVEITGGRHNQNDRHGIWVEDADAFTIAGAEIRNNSQETSNTWDGIHIAAGVTDFSVLGCRIDGISQQRYGIRIASGASDRYTILANTLVNNNSNQLSDSGTGLAKVVQDEDGNLEIRQKLSAAGSNDLIFNTNGSDRWRIQASGAHLRPSVDNAIDFGVTSNRVRRMHLGEYWEGDEMSDPTAPGSNKGRLYFRDNGSGLTQLVAKFGADGSERVIVTSTST